MTALAADTNLGSARGGALSFPVADSVKIYKGSIVCLNTAGYAVVGADTASYVCVGIADQQVDNTLSGHTAGGKQIKVISGRVYKSLPTSGATQATVGATIYVTDSATVGTTATNYVVVGICVGYNSSTSIDVWINEAPVGISGVSGLTATAGELNQLHSVTPGTTAASKALVVDSNKRLDALVLGTLSLGAGAGTAVTATAAEVNVLHSVTAGTTAASSALVVDAAKSVDTLGIRAQFALTSAASVAYAATMALIVATPVITVAAANGTSATATINCAAVAPAGATLTIVTSTDSSGTCTVTYGTHFKVTGTQATTLSKVSTISFIGDGTNWNEVGRATAM